MRRLSDLPLTVKLPFAITALVVLGVLVSNLASELLFETMPHSLLLTLELGAFALVSLATGILLARGISRPLVRIGESLREIGKNNLDAPVPVSDRGDEIGKIVRALGRCREQLVEENAIVREKTRLIEAISGGRQGMIEFDTQGHILNANKNFLEIVGYTQTEIAGRHRSVLANPDASDEHEERRKWDQLLSGESILGTFQGMAKGGRALWLQGTYCPVRAEDGEIVSVVLVASDVTEAKTRQAELEEATFQQRATIDALSSSQAIIEFDAKGKILRANENFANFMGYTEAEIVGRPHAMFVADNFEQTKEYHEMWQKLGRGEAVTGVFKRLAKGNREVWLQGSYNAVRDRNGAVQRVIKIASDITAVESARLDGIARREKMEENLNTVVNGLNAALSRLADGDLHVRITTLFAEDYEELRGNFNGAIQELESTISAVVVAASNIRNESNQVASAADDLAQRTENQAAALEQTTAALEELTTSVRVAAESAHMASGNGAETRTAAIKSGHVVKKAVKAMSRIERSSEKIGQIIGVIEDIAFQTNLLALNAGVEAARAGDAGRGFAVVASEVQALATRSSDAAKEIKALISTSSQQVGAGVDLVGETGKALSAIVDSVTSVTQLVDSIASSSREQSVGISEINTAVRQLDQVTQQNAAMVEEANAASHTMRSEAESLADLVSRFHTDTTPAGAAAPDSAAARKPALPGKSHPVMASSAPTKPYLTNGAATLPKASAPMVDNWEEF